MAKENNMEKDISLNLEQLPSEMQLILSIMTKNGQRYQDLTKKDWSSFLEFTMHHRLFPLLYTQLSNLKDWEIPSHVINSLENRYRKNTFYMLHLTSQMELINEQFGQKGIDTLFLKGPILAKELYGDLSLRTCGDIDLLIKIDDLQTADRIMKSLGYQKDEYIKTVLNDWKWRHHHYTYFHEQHGTKVEVHWRLNPAPSNEPGFSELWERRRKSHIHEKCTLFMLGSEDLFYFLVTHGARHGWSRLRWLKDIHELINSELNWDKIDGHITQFKYRKVAGQALILSSSLFQTDLPKEAQSFISSQSLKLADQALFYLKTRVNLHSEPVPRDVAKYHALHLFSLMNFEQKLLHSLMILHPLYTDAETLPLPKRLHFLYFPLKPIIWIWRKTRKSTLKNIKI